MLGVVCERVCVNQGVDNKLTVRMKKLEPLSCGVMRGSVIPPLPSLCILIYASWLATPPQQLLLTTPDPVLCLVYLFLKNDLQNVSSLFSSSIYWFACTVGAMTAPLCARCCLGIYHHPPPWSPSSVCIQNDWPPLTAFRTHCVALCLISGWILGFGGALWARSLSVQCNARCVGTWRGCPAPGMRWALKAQQALQCHSNRACPQSFHPQSSIHFRLHLHSIELQRVRDCSIYSPTDPHRAPNALIAFRSWQKQSKDFSIAVRGTSSVVLTTSSSALAKRSGARASAPTAATVPKQTQMQARTSSRTSAAVHSRPSTPLSTPLLRLRRRTTASAAPAGNSAKPAGTYTCRRCKQSFLESENSSAACRFHPCIWTGGEVAKVGWWHWGWGGSESRWAGLTGWEWCRLTKVNRRVMSLCRELSLYTAS